MTGLMQMMTEAPVATVFGVTGLACQLAWPLFQKRRSVLSVQMGIGSSYAVQYGLMGAWSGAGVALCGATQTLIALLAGERPWLRKLGLAFLPIIAVICFLTWGGLSSLFALTACSLVMIGRMQNDMLALRLFLLASAPFGIGYDLSVGALPALCGALTSAAINLTMLLRELKERGYFERGLVPAQ